MNVQALQKIIKYKILTSKSFGRLIPMSSKQKQYSDELQAEFEQIPAADTSNLSGAALEWATNMNTLRHHVFNYDIRRFLRWDVIRATMFVSYAAYIKQELESIKNSKDFESYWKRGIKESSVGLPIKSKLYRKSSGNLIHHAYHVQQFEEVIGMKVGEIDLVLEFGGGYGSLCRLIQNLGFNKKYVIFDLPLFSSLQKYYLKSLGHKVLNVNDFSKSESGVLCISNFEDLQKALNNVDSTKRNLFVATWSLSETPIILRRKIIELITDFEYFLIAYQDKFNEVDNNHFFGNMQKEMSHVNWKGWKIKHLPGNNYLIGKGLNH